jgi:hypothetical protein
MNGRRKGLMVGVAALVVFLVSCEKDISENRGGREKVEILFSINTTGYQTGADVVRSADAWESSSTTMYLNDSIYLRTTLVPDSVDETTFDGDQLRATTGFTDGQKLCFAAFLTNGTQVGTTAIYTYSTATNKWIPDGDPLGVEPNNSTMYRFVAYSYFGSTDTPGLSSFDPSKDLIWGSVEKRVEDTEVSRTVVINMLHVFARVRVLVRSTGANITTLSGVEVEGGKQATLTPFSGGISWGGAVTQNVSIASSGNNIYSSYRTVTPVTPAPTTVKVGSLKVSTSSTTFSNRTVSFNSTLNAGTSYTLVVDVKKLVWARSNIYWDGSKMTFVPAGTDNSKEGYQGLFFKFGSLVGISPRKWVDNSTLVYEAGNSTPTTASWYDILYWDDLGVVGNPNTSTLKGDICKYINSAYRLPQSGEFDTAGNWVYSGGFISNNSPEGNADGTSVISAYAENTLMGNIRFPAAGDHNAYGDYGSANWIGTYWIGNHVSGTGILYMRVMSNSVSINGINYSGSYTASKSVRCIRN